MMNSTSVTDQEFILARLILQLEGKDIHIVKSLLASNTVKKYNKTLSSKIKLFEDFDCKMPKNDLKSTI